MDSLESRVSETTIAGVLLQKLAVIPTAGGPVLHLLRSDYALFPYAKGFGELYFSEVLPGEIKAWKRHVKQTQLFAVPSGRMGIVLYDAREDSPTRETIEEINLGRPDSYALLRIPPGIWYGFRALGNSPALLCNAADLPHDPNESEKLPLNDSSIPYTFV